MKEYQNIKLFICLLMKFLFIAAIKSQFSPLNCSELLPAGVAIGLFK
jgi:hypothetical protein